MKLAAPALDWGESEKFYKAKEVKIRNHRVCNGSPAGPDAIFELSRSVVTKTQIHFFVGFWTGTSDDPRDSNCGGGPPRPCTGMCGVVTYSKEQRWKDVRTFKGCFSDPTRPADDPGSDDFWDSVEERF